MADQIQSALERVYPAAHVLAATAEDGRFDAKFTLEGRTHEVRGWSVWSVLLAAKMSVGSAQA